LERGTAVGLLLCGLSLWLLTADQPGWSRRAGQVAAGMAALIAALTFQSGRTPALPALSLGVTALALNALPLETRLGRWPYQLLAVATIATSLPVALAETYSMTSGRAPAYTAGMSLLSALAFLSLGLGAMLARSQEGVGRLVFAPGPGGLIARRVFPAAVGALILLSWLRFQGEQLGLYSIEIGLGLMVATMILVLGLLLYRSATALEAAAGQQRRAEAAMRQSQVMFQSFFEAAPDAVVAVEPGGLIVQANSQAARLFGYPHEQMLGRPVEQLIPERFRQQHTAHRTGFVTAPRPRPMGSGLELFGRRKDGSEFPVDIMLGPVWTADGLVVLSTVRDITERVRMQQTLAEHAAELARSNAELQQFAYVASHDLQEPLRMVASFTELLAKRYRGKLDTDADEFIHYVVDGAKRMQALIEDLLTYSRVGTRGRPFAATECDAVLDRVLSDLALALAETGGAVTRDPLPTVLADEPQLGQLLQNVISNALKFRGPAPPRVHVTAARDGTHWRFAVRDNGIGIAPEHAERIFGMFQRLHARGEYPGTGIGLAVCKKIVERHGGRMWVESEPGRGATFYFTIPAHDAAQ
jgi:PAS domain S-box-containing protein